MRIDCTEAAIILKEHYGIEGTLSNLPGDVDYNYKVKAQSGEIYLLKLSRKKADIKEWQSQLALCQHLENSGIKLSISNFLTDLRGQKLVGLESGNLMRLQSWVPGKLISEVSPLTNDLYNSWGTAMGQLSKALVSFEDRTLHREFRWDPSQTLLSRDRLGYLADSDEKELAQYFWQRFEEAALPKLAGLRKSINHSDGHDMNLLCLPQDGKLKVTGVIDFGDAVYSHTINELAIACAYAGMHRIEPLRAIREVVRGYHTEFPVQEEELSVLYYLITARLMVTVANAAWAQSAEPENEYLQISAQPAWRLLRQLRAIEPTLVEYALREVCGYEPCTQNTVFHDWLIEEQADFHPLVSYGAKKAAPLDLSAGSLELGNNALFDTPAAFTKSIHRILESKNAEVGYGGYGETRPIYTSDAFKVRTDTGPQWRTVHLGLDIWMDAGTPVHAPWAGTVHSFADNSAEGDYGPCIILKHEVSSELCFYTLYGHQSRAALTSLEVGQHIAKGEVFSQFGTTEERSDI